MSSKEKYLGAAFFVHHVMFRHQWLAIPLLTLASATIFGAAVYFLENTPVRIPYQVPLYSFLVLIYFYWFVCLISASEATRSSYLPAWPYWLETVVVFISNGSFLWYALARVYEHYTEYTASIVMYAFIGYWLVIWAIRLVWTLSGEEIRRGSVKVVGATYERVPVETRGLESVELETAYN
jgi:hypothetical protein